MWLSTTDTEVEIASKSYKVITKTEGKKKLRQCGKHSFHTRIRYVQNKTHHL